MIRFCFIDFSVTVIKELKSETKFLQPYSEIFRRTYGMKMKDSSSENYFAYLGLRLGKIVPNYDFRKLGHSDNIITEKINPLAKEILEKFVIDVDIWFSSRKLLSKFRLLSLLTKSDKCQWIGL